MIPRTLRPYSQMVQRLFKAMESPEAARMHAAIGMAGEAAEILGAASYKNMVEELGDYEFYKEALMLQLSIDENSTVGYPQQTPLTICNMTTQLSYHSGIILDLAKKSWIYNKPLDLPATVDALGQVEACLAFIRSIIGVTAMDIRVANQTKLAKRYPEGVYTDAAAQARADKPAGE